MIEKPMRVAAVAACAALGGVALMAPRADANDLAAPLPAGPQAWSFANNEAPQLQQAQERIADQRLMESKVALAAAVKDAEALYAAAQGKASPEALRALAVERNRAEAAVLVETDLIAVTPAGEGLPAAVAKVTEEVQAWEAAEAARKAEEARLAQQQASRGGGGGRAAAAPTGDPKAYLDGIAARYGTWIQWGPTACGHGTATKVAGCYTGGANVFVNDAAWQSWSVAKGRGRNVVLHEVSHVLIQNTCGTVFVSSRFENVTDAYAVLIGASNHTGYGYNDTDMALAQAILGGSCSL